MPATSLFSLLVPRASRDLVWVRVTDSHPPFLLDAAPPESSERRWGAKPIAFQAIRSHATSSYKLLGEKETRPESDTLLTTTNGKGFVLCFVFLSSVKHPTRPGGPLGRLDPSSSFWKEAFGNLRTRLFFYRYSLSDFQESFVHNKGFVFVCLGRRRPPRRAQVSAPKTPLAA